MGMLEMHSRGVWYCILCSVMILCSPCVLRPTPTEISNGALRTRAGMCSSYTCTHALKSTPAALDTDVSFHGQDVEIEARV